MNAHSNLWGSFKNDNNVGTQIINASDDLELIVLNNGTKTRLSFPNYQASAVDITLSSALISSNVNWQVPITFQF